MARARGDVGSDGGGGMVARSDFAAPVFVAPAKGAATEDCDGSLPPGWEKTFNSFYGCFQYYNEDGEVSWEHPGRELRPTPAGLVAEDSGDSPPAAAAEGGAGGRGGSLPASAAGNSAPGAAAERGSDAAEAGDSELPTLTPEHGGGATDSCSGPPAEGGPAGGNDGEDLPEGWERGYNAALGCVQYWNEEGEVRFSRPQEAAMARTAIEAAADAAQPPDATAHDREYDLVIYGATGYTGCLIIEHLDAVLSDRERGLRWAIAGRDEQRLAAIAAKCTHTPGVLHVRGTQEDVEAMAGACRVVLTTVGPYLKQGEPVVAACVRKGTHYLDVCGEPAFVHYMVQKYHARAKQAGVMVVHMVGQVCTPHDVSCYLLARHLGPMKQYRNYFFQYGQISGGSHATGVSTNEAMDDELHGVLTDPFSCGGRRQSLELRPEDEDCTGSGVDKLYMSLWLAPAYTGPPCSRMVRRSCELFEDTPAFGVDYGRKVSVTIRDACPTKALADTVFQVLPPPLPPEKAGFLARTARNAVATGEAPKPGLGPGEELRALSGSESFALGKGESGKWAHVRYSGPDAYETTAISSVASALTLVDDIADLEPRGGVLSPAYAFHGSKWIERLQERAFARSGNRPLSWTLLKGKPPESEIEQAMGCKGALLVQLQKKRQDFAAPPYAAA